MTEEHKEVLTRGSSFEHSKQEHDVHVIRLHEKLMDNLDKRITAVEKKIDQIPWILCAALFNIVLNLFLILTKYWNRF